MENSNSSRGIITKLKALDVLREQENCIFFTEGPSDKYDQVKENRPGIKGQDLFLLFTADIIKEKVLFTR